MWENALGPALHLGMLASGLREASSDTDLKPTDLLSCFSRIIINNASEEIVFKNSSIFSSRLSVYIKIELLSAICGFKIIQVVLSFSHAIKSLSGQCLEKGGPLG